MKLLEEAATLAENKIRSQLIDQTLEATNKKSEPDKVLLITRYNPNFHDLRHITYGNWDMLGKSPATEFLYERQLMMAYRRPRNLRDLLVRANIPYKEGDEETRPNWHTVEPAPIETEGACAHLVNQVAGTQELITDPIQPKIQQKTILDFFTPMIDTIGLPSVNNVNTRDVTRGVDSTETTRAPATSHKTSTQECTLTPKKNRGFNFCNVFNCRYCKLINKSGSITSTVTKKEHRAMYNVSCRSSNLVYAITCKKCLKQYVGQTSLRLKGRFVYHFYTVEKPDKSKPVGKHFSQLDHQGIDDMDIYILEFISKPPKSVVAAAIRDRVEKRWIHLLRSTAPGGLNLDD
jgi:hypothetical protein